jgi:hypothetical protein
MPLQRGQIIDIITSSRDFGIDGRTGDAPTQIRRSNTIGELALLFRAFSSGFDAESQKVSRVKKFHKHIVSEKG